MKAARKQGVEKKKKEEKRIEFRDSRVEMILYQFVPKQIYI